jgi:hypothetical protein
MVKFGLGNYEDYLFKAIVGSSFAKNGLMTVVTYILTSVVRFHVSVIVCILINGTFFTDIIFPVIVSVLLSLASNNIYRYIETHRSQYEKVVDYFIDNYSWENLMMWKRYLLGILIGYILLVLIAVSIDNYFIFLTTMQATASFIICDLLENRNTLVRRIKTWWYQPSVKFVENRNPGDLVFDSRLIVTPSNPDNSNLSLRSNPSTIESPTPLRRVPVSIGGSKSLLPDINRPISPSPMKPSTPPSVEEGLIPISSRPATPPSINQRVGMITSRIPTPPPIYPPKRHSHSYSQEVIPIPPVRRAIPEFEETSDSEDEIRSILESLDGDFSSIEEDSDKLKSE